MPDATMLSEDATLLVLPDAQAMAGSDIVHSLQVVEEGGRRRRLAVIDRQVTIGRAAPSDVLIESSLVSRQHCRLQVDGEQVSVTDLGSTNGTLLDGVRVQGTTPLQHGSVLQLGRVSIAYERRTRREIDEAAAIDRDLQGASAYVHMLLPRQIQDGPLRVNWLFLPCAELGGNAFGYRFLEEHLFAGYMVDVAGQGTEAAMHSVSVMNLLRQHAVPGMDLADPSSVLRGMNATFRQEDHNGMFFLMWYFVLDLRTRRLLYASAGRHPGYLVPPERRGTLALSAPGPAIGLAPGHAFPSCSVEVAAGSMLYLLSDGASESLARSTEYGAAGRTEALIGGRLQPGTPEPMRLHDALQTAWPSDAPAEDLSFLVIAM